MVGLRLWWQHGRARMKAAHWLVQFCRDYPNFGLAGLVRQSWGKPVTGIDQSPVPWWTGLSVDGGEHPAKGWLEVRD